MLGIYKDHRYQYMNVRTSCKGHIGDNDAYLNVVVPQIDLHLIWPKLQTFCQASLWYHKMPEMYAYNTINIKQYERDCYQDA